MEYTLHLGGSFRLKDQGDTDTMRVGELET